MTYAEVFEDKHLKKKKDGTREWVEPRAARVYVRSFYFLFVSSSFFFFFFDLLGLIILLVIRQGPYTIYDFYTVFYICYNLL